MCLYLLYCIAPAQTGSSAFQAGEVYIIADVDDHELLKREIAEGRIVVKTMQSSIKERLRAYTHNTQVSIYRYPYRQLVEIIMFHMCARFIRCLLQIFKTHSNFVQLFLFLLFFESQYFKRYSFT